MRFADTSYFIALLNPADTAHSLAVAASDAREVTVTTDFILIELANAMAKAPDRRLVTVAIERLRADRDVIIMRATSEWVHLGWTLYCSRPDKGWSLTDCISFEVMRQMNIREALTGDHHFEQAGFVALLKS